MPLYFAYGANMNREAMARRCPRSSALVRARLARHRLAVMREGWLTVVRDPRASVHGVLWDVALSDVPPLDRYEGLAQGLYAKIAQPVLTESGQSGRWSMSAPTPDRGRRVRTIWPRSLRRRAPGRCQQRRSERWSSWGPDPRASGARARSTNLGRRRELNSSRPPWAPRRLCRRGSATRSDRPEPGA